MSEFGPESAAPGEDGSGAPEQLGEEARQRFAAAGAAMQAAKREEKKSKKRDTRVARTIIQFLNDDKYAHLFVLISRLVARDCPSIFILAVLSLINEDCAQVVREYLEEATGNPVTGANETSALQLVPNSSLDPNVNRMLIEWITRMQMVLSFEASAILEKLMVDDHNIDGTVLQLTTFVIQDYFASIGRKIEFQSLHAFTASVLQSVFDPFMDAVDLRKLQSPASSNSSEDDDD